MGAERKIMEAVAKHMRHKVHTKSAVIKGQKVEYFSGMLGGHRKEGVLMDLIGRYTLIHDCQQGTVP